MLSNTEEILEELKQGKMVLIVDDESRENEGDFIMAASKVTPDDINFMSKYARGLICLTLTRERCKQLNLPLMKTDTDSKHETNFTISIEASEGVTTGISAYDRAHTIRTAVMPDATSSHISRPGHIFPLMAQPGGVLTRAGHTEAGCDLTRLAGFEPAAVIVEIMSDDGSMARLPELEKIAKDHDIKIGTIEDLIKYRTKHEKTVIRENESLINTEFGEFNLVSYEDILSKTAHIALIKGDIKKDKSTFVRVHIQNTIKDILHSSHHSGWPLKNAMQRINKEGNGVVLILRWNESVNDIIKISKK
jgi:3,4-dihydroxy 2-butanone 4-phosphate synthase/GTP cyclohydrolase II